MLQVIECSSYMIWLLNLIVKAFFPQSYFFVLCNVSVHLFMLFNTSLIKCITKDRIDMKSCKQIIFTFINLKL